MSIGHSVGGLALALALTIAAWRRGRSLSWKSPFPPTEGARHPTARDFTARSLLAAHNLERARRGLPLLRLNSRLNAAAQAHANHMAAVGKMAHQGIGDGDPESRIRGNGYDLDWAGENVAWNQKDATTVVQEWMDSREHRDNILGQFDEMGGAMAPGRRNEPYWCVTFGSRWKE